MNKSKEELYIENENLQLKVELQTDILNYLTHEYALKIENLNKKINEYKALLQDLRARILYNNNRETRESMGRLIDKALQESKSE